MPTKNKKGLHKTVFLIAFAIIIFAGIGVEGIYHYQDQVKKQVKVAPVITEQENQVPEEQPSETNSEENQPQVAPPENVVSSNLPSGWIRDKWSYDDNTFNFSIDHPSDWTVDYIHSNPGELATFYLGINNSNSINSILFIINEKDTLTYNNLKCLDEDYYNSSSDCRQFGQTTFNGINAISEEQWNSNGTKKEACILRFNAESHYFLLKFSGESDADICTSTGILGDILNSIKFF